GDGVVCSSTPAGLVATTAHFGPYARLGEAHQAILRWCADHGYKLAGPSWEVYGHWDDDPAKLRTDIYYLLQTGNETTARCSPGGALLTEMVPGDDKAR